MAKAITTASKVREVIRRAGFAIDDRDVYKGIYAPVIVFGRTEFHAIAETLRAAGFIANYVGNDLIEVF